MRIVVATTVMLSFISFWRAAAIVLNDLGSSAFYAVGIAWESFGPSAPWLILAVMLFANFVRGVYIESCSMFVRGGVYRVVKEAMGSTAAKFSVSALMFDYILTGPISGVSAGQYLAGLLNDFGNSAFLASHNLAYQVPKDLVAMLFAVAVTVYFWRRNIHGMHESSERALQIMWVVTAMAVIMIGWSALTLLQAPHINLPPLPTTENLHFHQGSLGWLQGTGLPHIWIFAVLIAFGHSVLAMSGEESLAQVNREIEHPKLKNLKRAGIVIGIYTFIFTGGISLLALTLIPPAQMATYKDNVISGLAMNVVGPLGVRLALQAFVVLVGVLMLSGAVNTAIIGSNGVLNRVAEDGILRDWFRRPHKKYGTTSRLINMVVVLQLLTIVASHGDILVLSEAYAFGVIWSFTMMTSSTLALRFQHPAGREWRLPFNIRIGKKEIPVLLGMIALALLAIALTNLLTKKVATISGIGFTVVMFVIFTISERITARERATQAGMDQFRLHHEDVISMENVGVQPGNVLVAVRDGNTLDHLRAVLERTDTGETDVVVMTTRLVRGMDFAGEFVADEHLFSEHEQVLFTRVVGLAEKLGKPVSLAVVPGTDPFEAILLTATRLQSGLIVVGKSSTISDTEKGLMAGRAWEKLPQPRPRLNLEILDPQRESRLFHLGPHDPRLRPEDLEMLHRLWLELSTRPDLRHLHHHQLVTVALRRLASGLRRGADADAILQELRNLAGPPERPKS